MLALWITLSLSEAYSQDSKFGIKGGFNLSDLYTKDVKSSNFRMGYHGGVFAKLAVSSLFAIQPELLYSTKGACLEYENASLSGQANFNLNYIDIPVLAVFNLSPRYSIHFGPYFSMITDATLENEKEGEDYFNFENQLDKKDFSFADYGLAAGVGIDFRHVGIGVRYSHGLQNIGKEWTFNDLSFRFPDATNALFQVYLTANLFRF